jgi:transcriptional regulator with XRE-family HTH domain
MVLLRKLRHDKKISMTDLAKVTGVNRYVITNIENKQYKSSNENMKKLADYFGIKEPLELTTLVFDVTESKKCLNQRCPLNRECYCQSEQVIAGASCESQNLVTDKPKPINFNGTQALFIN